MGLPRKLLLVGSAITVLMLTAGPASAEMEVFPEDGFEPCPEVSLNTHHVEGGCVLEIESTMHKTLVAYVPMPVALSKCNIHLEARIGGDGTGWVTQAQLTSESPPSQPTCTRTACDEATGEMLAWPIQIEEHAPTEEVGEITFCLRTLVSDPGSTGTPCELHLPLTTLGDHEYDIGADETFCESAPAPLALQDLHFAYEEGTDGVEFIH